tara:strand:- start:263 stop:460 length:198 start_codon:yes stop_codon:yes gene_type:complete
MYNNEIEFWANLRELNALTTILAIECPEYADRVNHLKSNLTKEIKDNLERSKEIAKFENKYWIQN